MKKKSIGYLLIPMLFAVLILLSVGSVEALYSKCEWHNVTGTIGTISDITVRGHLNMTVNITKSGNGDAHNGTYNVTFYATGQDGTKMTLSTTANNTGNTNQTMFEYEWDTNLVNDQSYTISAQCCIYAGCSDIDTDATNIVIDNAPLNMSWSSSAQALNNTIQCPLASDVLRFRVNQTTPSEQINGDPVLYFRRFGTREVFTHQFTVSRTGATTNYSDMSNYSISSTYALPEDLYTWWITYRDTDGDYYNSTINEFEIDCVTHKTPPAVIEELTRVDGKNIVVAFLIILGIVLFSKRTGK